MQNQGKTALGLDTNIGALLCYMPLCAVSLIYSIIVLVTDKDNKNVRFHAFQSLLLTGGYIVLVIALSVVGAIVGGITGSVILGSLFSLVTLVVALGFIIAMIIGCVKGFQGSSYKLPIIGDMAEKWS
jgi:uncharacterized membrane protein